MFIRALAVGLTLVAASGAEQPVGDPLAGHWELNVARSRYGGGAELRTRGSFDCALAAAIVTCTIRSVMADGRLVDGGFTATYGGAPGRVHGISDADAVSLVKVSDAIADATFTLHGRAAFGYRAVRATDGRSLTIVSVDPLSRAVLNSVVVYDARPGRQGRGRPGTRVRIDSGLTAAAARPHA